MDLAQALQELSVQVVGFLVLFAVLKRVAWRPLLSLLDERRRRIEDGFKQLASSKEELARLQADYGRRLSRIEDEARAKIQQAVLEGKRIAMEIQEEARAQGADLMHKSKEAVALELAKAKVTLRDDLVSMATEAIERILRGRLDAERDRRLVEEVLDELEREAPAP